ncbi:AMP-binding protein [Marinactinospora thermotolerans]|uniref:Long-chain acyl-CoA synthetase n=1 Tax=Marinactinospora thermotolerans DSM 45154 TaxID=1122192 RepID=A0A1T4P8C4_9ACTN|nr:AMP-binding protein [Marinactinospora thermotolerans]SJZ87835.1 long-chain acyl-CoA synthetase [Marinactinospora thermotolerans DSM 45154]
MGQARAERNDPSVTPSGLADLVYRNAHEAPRAPAFTHRVHEQWVDVTTTGFLRDVTAVAKGLIAAGVGSGDRVVVVGVGGYAWPLLAFALWAVRAVVVPVHPACPATRLAHLVRDCRPAAVVLPDGRHAGEVAALQRELHDLGRIWRLDREGIEAITRPGAYIDPSAVRFRREETRRADPAAIVYPASTRPRVRGVVVTHGNLLAAAQGVVEVVGPLRGGDGQAGALVHLPPAAPLWLVAITGCVLARARAVLAGPGRSVERDARETSPEVVLTHPRVLERIGGGEPVGPGRETPAAGERRRGAWRLVARSRQERPHTRLREALGGRATVVVCAGERPPEPVARRYAEAGIAVVHGFGLATTSGPFLLDTAVDGAGTGGRALPGAQVRVSAEGEVLVRGPLVSPGWWGESGDDGREEGWLATGVRGEVDGEGRLSVRGALSPTRGGPQAEDGVALRLEAALLEHPLIGQAMVMDRGFAHTGALLTLDRDQLEYWRLVNGRSLSATPAELAADPLLREEIDQAVRAANAEVDPRSAIRSFHVLPEPFSLHSGLVLASGRLRRDAVLRAFAEEIAAMYQVETVREEQ